MREFRIVTIDLAGEREELVFQCDENFDYERAGIEPTEPIDWFRDYINPELYKSVQFIGTWW